VRLKGGEQTVTVTAGPHGPLYSAVAASGAVLASNATLDELKAQHPSIYRFVHPAMVTDAPAPVPARGAVMSAYGMR
jgi:hypothetical protein